MTIPQKTHTRQSKKSKKYISGHTVPDTLAHDTASDRWDAARVAADVTAWVYRGHKNNRVRRWGDRIAECAKTLRYDWRNGENGWSRRLVSARLCRVRTCPICMWRRSLKLQTQLLAKMERINRENPTLRPVLLTLTVRNCDVSDLKTTVKSMLAGWSKLTRRASMSPVVGWIRGLEVTPGKRNIKNDTHPHIHALLLVDDTWISDDGRRRMDKFWWADEWQDVMDLDYRPTVDVRTITNEGGIIEVLKYCVKSADYSGDTQWLPNVALALDAVRVFASGGIIRVTEPDLDDDADDHRTHVEKIPFTPGYQPKKSLTIIYSWVPKIRHYTRLYVFVDPPPTIIPPPK